MDRAPHAAARRKLADRREIVEHPEAATVRAEDEVAVLDSQVVYRHDRQVAAEPMPFGSVVEGDVDAGLAPGVKEPAPRRILADDAREVVGPDAVRDLRPCAPVVRRLPEIRAEVVVLVARGRDERHRCVVRRCLDDRNERERSDPRGRDVLPRLPLVARDMQESVVAPGPEHAALDRRFGEREDRAVVLGAGVVLRDRPARWPELALVVARQVGADAFPRRPLVGAPEHVVSAVIQHVRVVR